MIRAYLKLAEDYEPDNERERDEMGNANQPPLQQVWALLRVQKILPALDSVEEHPVPGPLIDVDVLVY